MWGGEPFAHSVAGRGRKKLSTDAICRQRTMRSCDSIRDKVWLMMPRFRETCNEHLPGAEGPSYTKVDLFTFLGSIKSNPRRGLSSDQVEAG